MIGSDGWHGANEVKVQSEARGGDLGERTLTGPNKGSLTSPQLRQRDGESRSDGAESGLTSKHSTWVSQPSSDESQGI